MTDDLHARLNRETARIPWHELQPHFARGATIYVAPELDLIEVAVRFVRDDSACIRAWLEQGSVAHVDETRAASWAQGDASLWAVVVAPWVLVQPEPPSA